MSAVLEAHEPSAQYLVAEQPTLVRQFVLLATAPGGVPRLRELILTLAVQGKLVEQSERDEPVAVVLREIQLAKGGAVPRRRLRATDTDDALIAPFALPDTWDWVRLGEVTDISGGVTLGRKGAIEQPLTLPYLRVANVQRWNVLCDDLKTITIGRAELARYQLRAGDLLITEGGDWDKVGRTAIWRDELAVCLHQNHVFKARGLTPRWNPEWAQLYLNSPIARTYFASCSKQTTNLASINMTQLKSCAFPLPPVAEQARIVARVDELMCLCDALEAKGRLEAEQHARMLGTLLGTLTDNSTPEELAANWQRVADHFDLLLDRPEAVDALEQTILQLAVRGLLVPQDPRDEPASSLLEKIRTNGEQKKVRGRQVGAVASEVQPDEGPFEVPQSWAWSRFGQVAEIASDLVSPAGHGSDWQVAPDCIEKGTGRLLKKRTVADADVKSANHRFHPGQIIYSKIRPSLSKAVIVDFAGLCSADMYPINAKVSTQYLLLVILSRCFLDQVVAAENRVKMPKLNQEALTAFLVPVPPLAEQERIVTRVTELRRLCADLRQRLSAVRTTHSRLAEALVESAAA